MESIDDKAKLDHALHLMDRRKFRFKMLRQSLKRRDRFRTDTITDKLARAARRDSVRYTIRRWREINVAMLKVLT